jgi:hypothetical protein
MFNLRRVEFIDPQSKTPQTSYAAVDDERGVTVVLFSGQPGLRRCLYISSDVVLEVGFDEIRRSDHTEVWPSWRYDLKFLFMQKPETKVSRPQLQKLDKDMIAAIEAVPSVFGFFAPTRVLRSHHEDWLNSYDL